MSLQLTDPKGRSHQTAVVVDGERFDKGGKYAERVKRLAQSLNGNNIKADIFVRRGNDLVRVDEKTLVPFAQPKAQDTGETAVDLLVGKGYTLVLPVVGGNV